MSDDQLHVELEGARSTRLVGRVETQHARIELCEYSYVREGSHVFRNELGRIELSLTARGPAARLHYPDLAGEPAPQLGQLIYVPAGQTFQGAWGEQAMTVLVCHFKDTEIEKGQKWSPERLAAALSIDDPVLLRLMLELKDEIDRKDMMTPMMCEGLCLQLRAALARYLSTIGQVFHDLAVIASPALRAALSRIDGTRTTPSLAELASDLGYSPRHLSRIFLAATGQTFSDYAKAQRHQQARTLLGATDKSLKQIAWELGFSSAAGFSTSFRMQAGTSPLHYRRAIRSGARPV